ncbi:MAG TPA: methylmalonyl-CoA epimerase [Deltaproteobacteria bacterium]|jgi:methylmalonyl-CoA epimerase|nr:methylmalonyl-CoA epimerase [Deltaproteobacteria bacterium]
MQEPRIEGIEEVVIAVRGADSGAKYFKDLFGMEFPFGWEVPHEKVKVRSERISGTQLQFIESTDPEGVVAKFIDERGEGLNHIAFRVSNLREMVKRLKIKGVRFIPEEPLEFKDKKFPLAKGNIEYIFIHPKSARGVLIELIEPK